MIHQYLLTGMTCSNCEAKVKSALLMVPHVTHVEVSRLDNKATITMDQHVSLSKLQEVLDKKYVISTIDHNEVVEQSKSWINTYKPVLLIFAYILGITIFIQSQNPQFNLMQWMRHFMAGFFLIFSFFKMLNLKGFTETYVMYDVIAKRFPNWAFIYAFVELFLGIAFLTNFNPFYTNLIALIVMSLSIIGVLQTVINKKKIQCACLGAIFNLPMSTVTIIEDSLMIVMSAIMLILM